MDLTVAITSFLSSGDTTKSTSSDIVVLAAIMIGVVLLLGIIWVFVKAKIRESTLSEAESAFDLGTLRKLHKEGQMSDQEFEQAKAVILAAYTNKQTDEDAETDDTSNTSATEEDDDNDEDDQAKDEDGQCTHDEGTSGGDSDEVTDHQSDACSESESAEKSDPGSDTRSDADLDQESNDAEKST